MREGLALDLEDPRAWVPRAECRPTPQLMAFVASHFRRRVMVWTLFGPMPVYRLDICLVPCPSRTRGLPQVFSGGRPESEHALSLSFSPYPGHWAKECPNRDKSPRTVCHKCHQLGHWAALCPRDPRASRPSAKPTLTMVQED